MNIKVGAVIANSPEDLIQRLNKLYNTPQIEILEVHYITAAGAFVHYREKEEWEKQDE